MTTKNLGLVKAIHVGTTPPVNIIMLWYDDNIGVKKLKYYDTLTSAWVLLTQKQVPLLEPAINFVDGNAVPPSSNEGDVYVLIDLGNGPVHPDWGSNDYDDHVTRTTGVWFGVTPLHGYYCHNKTNDYLYYFDNSDWKTEIDIISWGTITGNISDQTDLWNYLQDVHTQNTDTKLDEGGADEVSANEIRVFIDSKAQNNGLASLDSGGKVPTSQLPLSVQGGIKVIGFWNASTNTPDLSSLTLTQGQAYQVSVAGSTSLNGESNWRLKDLAVWDDNLAGNYFKIDNTDDVLSVRGETGAVTGVAKRVSSASDPTVTDDTSAGYLVGDIWVNTTSDKSYVLVDATNGAAIWKIAGADIGKLAIYDANGEPTFYSTLTAAFAAATSGQTIQILTSYTETLTTTLTLPLGVNVNLNGNTLTFAQPNANSSIQTSASVGYVGQFINGTVKRSSGNGILFSVLNTVSDVQIDFTGLITDYTLGQHFVSAKAETEPKFKNLTCIGTTNNPVSGATVVENFTVKTTSGYCFENITAIKCTASTTSGRCYSSATTINSIGYSTSGTVYFSSNCYNSFGSSSSGIAFRDCTTVSCYGYSNSSWANYVGAKIELSKMYSVSNNAVSGNPEISNSLLISDSSYPLNVGNGCKINNNRIICNWNSPSARGIIMGTGCEISHNSIRMANASSYGIAFGAGESSYGVLNSAAGCAGVYHPGHTQLTVNTSDAQGNILSF